MFGKKKVAQEVKEFHCTACGIDCHDQYNLNRHLSWAHPGLEAPMAGSKKELNTGKKA